MSGAHGGGTRDRDTIERELRVLASVRSAYASAVRRCPSIDQMDALLDELIELAGRGKHRLESGNPDARPSLWR